ncbi:hypothetical protein EDD16DRAFT_1694885 [Pisolithus croceorrhizus]|nr:hypothetical protein EDD16DRAFT_1694885 [Pisolithus croceorrhizus]
MISRALPISFNLPHAMKPHFSRDLVTQFQEKSRELGTLNRVYCARQTCSRFLGPLTETLFGVTVYDCSAPNCGTRTCASCRGQYDGWMHTCRRDQGAEHVLNLGHTEGWSRCPGCSQLIELGMGCYHMTCRCRTEFCYLCRARWKTCRCPQWDERRLIAAAEQRVDAQLGGGGHHLRLRNVRRAELVDPLQPVQPRAPSDPVVQPRAQLVQPRALHAVPAVRTPVAILLPDTNGSTTDPSSTSTSNVGTHNDTTCQRMIRETAERLRIDHDCQHTWKYRHGEGRCENCHHTLLYLFRCVRCEMLVCNRCHRNRL